MILKAKKSSLLLLKGDMKTDIFGVELPIVKEQKDLGVLVSSDLTWSSNVDLRTSKALRALYQIKRNVSKNVTLQAKLNAYTGYVPILVYGSQVSHLTTMCLRKVEKIQRLATKWFFGVNVDCKTRLIKCGLLPFSMYIELHDVLFMRDLLKNKYDYTTTNEMNLKESKRRRQDARNELEIPKVNRNKCSENFFHRTAKLVNILSRKLGSLEDLNNPKLSYLYRNFFPEQYNELNTCSWRILCSFGSCNPHSKL